jgi:hypothetical protein
MKKLPPLSPEVEALLAPHRKMLPLAPAVESRAIARAAALVESSERAVVHAPAHPWWVFAAAACAVFALGAGAYAARDWTGWPASRGASRTAPVAKEPRPQVVAAVEPEREAPETIVASTQRVPKRVAAKAITATSVPTNAELLLLGVARNDLTRGDFVGALAAVSEHEQRFRHGSLVEEREALRVKSLAGLGRRDEAQRAAARFHARFPHSVLLSTFEHMTEPDR